MFATVFDKTYAARGIAMIQSLLRHTPNVKITILCLDLETELACQKILDSEGIVYLKLDHLGSDLVKSVRIDRQYREFCWTLGALLCRHLLVRDIDEVIYLDADICFFADSSPLLAEARTGDLAAIRHQFPTRFKKYEANGLFNVQWVYFRNSEVGRLAAEKWAAQCISNCSYDPDNGVVGDQKYLDEWPILYPNFISLSLQGAGIAPWNHEVFKPTKNKSGNWEVTGGSNLIFYHFQGLRIDGEGLVTRAGPEYRKVMELPIELYDDYLSRIAAIEAVVSHLTGTVNPALWRLAPYSMKHRISTFLSRLKSRYVNV